MKRHATNIRLACMLALLFWSAGLRANTVDPFPDVNPNNFYGNMSVTLKVMKNGEALQDVIVAAYSGGQIRGKGSPSNPAIPGLTYLTVWGIESGENIDFRLYVKDEGRIYVKNNMLNYSFNGIIGSTGTPYELEITYGCVSVLQMGGTDREIAIDGDMLEDNMLTSDITAQKVSYKRTFTTPYATICLPFDVSQADAAVAGTFYEFSRINEYDEVVMTEVANGLTANTPYIVKPASTSDEVSFSHTGNVTFPLTATPETTDNNNPSNWSFKGAWTVQTFQGTPAGKAIYFFAAAAQTGISPGDFVQMNTESVYTKAAPFRAYLEYTGNGNLSFPQHAPSRGTVVDNLPKSMKVIIENRDGSSYEIGTITEGNDAWYFIDGRRIGGRPAVPGLYIKNGHKVLIKED